MLRVGLTGGVACGKSHVLRRLAAEGLRTLDLDEVAHEVTLPGGAAYSAVVAAFGSRIVGRDGAIDRKALGAIVFEDAAARARLNAIVHPLVREEEVRRVAALADDPGAIVVTDAALLVEAGVHLRFDRLVVVHCAPEEQLRRLRERDALDERAARARISAQMPNEEKRRFAHFDVDTSGPLETTDRTAVALAQTLQAVAVSLPAPIAVPRDRALACLQRGPGTGPRGLAPALLLAEIASAGGIEMERVARLLVPPCDGPWYRCARDGETGPGPERLAGALVLWALGRGGPDPDFVVAAAASLARLTHRDATAVAASCLLALALMDVGTGARPRLAQWRRLSERWAGAPPPGWVEALVAGPDAGHAELRGALAGLARGEWTPDAEIAALLDRLAAPRR